MIKKNYFSLKTKDKRKLFAIKVCIDNLPFIYCCKFFFDNVYFTTNITSDNKKKLRFHDYLSNNHNQ